MEIPPARAWVASRCCHHLTTDHAIASQKNQSARHLFVFDVEPRPHQEEILADLVSERANGHHKNLVVAATGGRSSTVASDDSPPIDGTANSSSRKVAMPEATTGVPNATTSSAASVPTR